jgi:arabinogalactan oligomer/maltooligosaccharide transport system permease protein
MIRLSATLCAAAFAAMVVVPLTGCGQGESKRVVNLWHQMRPEDRAILMERVADFEEEHEHRIQVRVLYKETEELRSALVSAVLADRGPEIVYGASDVVGVYHAMGALADMSHDFTAGELAEFDPRTLVRFPPAQPGGAEMLAFVGDRYGNHLALVYNRNFVPTAPQTLTEFRQAAIKNTIRENGVTERYGLVWNYTEPYFLIPFLTGHGAWVFDERSEATGRPTPTLDTPEMVAGLEFVVKLRHQDNVLPQSADYEAAAALFLAGKAAMIIDGDWSWQNYLSRPGLNAAIAPLPIVESTGLPMAPMASPKGYSLTAFANGQARDDAIALIKFLTNEDTQRVYLERQKILPSRFALRDDPLVTNDPVMAVSLLQAERARTMPAFVEMRAVWDAMKPPYQLLIGGTIDAAEAARRMQQDALVRIQSLAPDPASPAARALALALAAGATIGFLAWQRRNMDAFVRDLPRQKLAYAMALPSIVLIFLTVLYPLAYNVVLSFSNMSLTNLRDWDLVGLRNYQAIATGHDSRFWAIFAKTVFWTVVNVGFHVTIGVLLAVTLNGPVRGKSLYRVLLILPWAVPAYITALTWRGMFEYDFGAVNNAIRGLNWLNSLLPQFLQLEPVNWLGEPGPALAACIIANVWLGFPFMMVIALGGLQGIPAELYEAARIDRASRWQQFRHITLPMLRPVLVPAVTLGALWTFNNLNVVWLVSNGGEPADQTHILVSYVYKAVFNMYQYGYGAALSMVIFGILLTFSLVFLSRTRATEAAY